jgi:predicted small lipoprotein YifL
MIRALLIAALLALGLTACGKKEETAPPPAAEAEKPAEAAPAAPEAEGEKPAEEAAAEGEKPAEGAGEEKAEENK